MYVKVWYYVQVFGFFQYDSDFGYFFNDQIDFVVYFFVYQCQMDIFVVFIIIIDDDVVGYFGVCQYGYQFCF